MVWGSAESARAPRPESYASHKRVAHVEVESESDRTMHSTLASGSVSDESTIGPAECWDEVEGGRSYLGKILSRADAPPDDGGTASADREGGVCAIGAASSC